MTRLEAITCQTNNIYRALAATPDCTMTLDAVHTHAVGLCGDNWMPHALRLAWFIATSEEIQHGTR